MSRIGNKPVVVPQGVKVEIKDRTISVTGPKGTLNKQIPDRISVSFDGTQIKVTRQSNIATDRALHGVTRALIANMVKGVTEGYSKELEIIGVGFKAALQGNILKLELGFSHPVEFPVPGGIKIETPKPTLIKVSGIDKEKVGETAAEIRAIYKPEPYKGKGIRYVGEIVRKKIGKAQATGK
ncbi:MAG: 50S ribosomal protein L6 [Candidatus Omnitrophica bacterium]|nr:50S ribosomal protein L6 [Candidatus Omnitrophota bacterium]